MSSRAPRSLELVFLFAWCTGALSLTWWFTGAIGCTPREQFVWSLIEIAMLAREFRHELRRLTE